MSDGGKGSKRRPSLVTDKRLLDNWDRIFNSKPNEEQFTKEKDDTPTKPKSTASNKKNLQQAQKRRRITARVVGRNRR